MDIQVAVGFVGLGRMGLPMAVNLIEAGVDVVGTDLDKEQKGALEDAGGQAVDSIDEAVANAEVAITVLRTPEQVLAAAAVAYTQPRAHETGRKIVCRVLLDTKIKPE